MAVDIDPVWLVSVFLLTLRIGVLLLMTPIFSSLAGLLVIRILFTLSLSVMLVSGLGMGTLQVSLTPGSLIAAAIAELLLGGVMGFGVFAAFGAFSVAGKVLDIQSGFGIGSIFDPVTRGGAPLFATMLNLLAVAVFFGMDGHHAFLRGIAYSIQKVAPGAGFPVMSVDVVLRQFGLMFSLGTALIAPVMFCLLLVEAGLAMMSRVLPQMNIFVVGIPVRIVAALAMFALTIASLAPVMGRVYASIFTYWEQVLP